LKGCRPRKEDVQLELQKRELQLARFLDLPFSGFGQIERGKSPQTQCAAVLSLTGGVSYSGGF
jgi:hypothetical protein